MYLKPQKKNPLTNGLSRKEYVFNLHDPVITNNVHQNGYPLSFIYEHITDNPHNLIQYGANRKGLCVKFSFRSDYSNDIAKQAFTNPHMQAGLNTFDGQRDIFEEDK